MWSITHSSLHHTYSIGSWKRYTHPDVDTSILKPHHDRASIFTPISAYTLPDQHVGIDLCLSFHKQKCSRQVTCYRASLAPILKQYAPYSAAAFTKTKSIQG